MSDPDADEVVVEQRQASVDTGARPSPSMEKAVAAIALLFGVALLVGARSIRVRNETGGIDPRLWPTAIAVGILAAAGWMTFNALTGRRGERDLEAATRHGWVQAAITVVITAVVLVLWQVGVSFLLLGPLYLIALNLLYGLRNLGSLLLFPGIIATIVYLVFLRLLGVQL